jgi:chromosome partitioning protein
MERIVIINPKGGSGKTTVATNLAAYFAMQQQSPMLVDLDSQASSVRWTAHRPIDRPAVDCIAGFKDSALVTRSFQMRARPGCNVIVVDTPAAIEARRMPELTRGADAILVPVMPSEIDIHATAKCIADLLLVAKVRRSDNRLGIIANRVKVNTRVERSLMKFLESLQIPIVATLRDTQNYVRAAQEGIGICELPRWQAQQDVASWEPLYEWLCTKRAAAPPMAAKTDKVVSLASVAAQRQSG